MGILFTLYVTPTALSCRKARQWLQEHHIPFIERNIFCSFLSAEEFDQILFLLRDEKKLFPFHFSTSRHSFSLDREAEWYHTLVQHPYLLKRPILVGNTHITIGFNEECFKDFLFKEQFA